MLCGRVRKTPLCGGLSGGPGVVETRVVSTKDVCDGVSRCVLDHRWCAGALCSKLGVWHVVHRFAAVVHSCCCCFRSFFFLPLLPLPTSLTLIRFLPAFLVRLVLRLFSAKASHAHRRCRTRAKIGRAISIRKTSTRKRNGESKILFHFQNCFFCFEKKLL